VAKPITARTTMAIKAFARGVSLIGHLVSLGSVVVGLSVFKLSVFKLFVFRLSVFKLQAFGLLVLTPKAFANFSPGLLQPWVRKKQDAGTL
jgi:hypothetical protein